MFSIEERNPRVVFIHRPSGRLMRPSDHTINGYGLGELDGFLDVLKNFGSGIVKMATAGIYDPSKNRFYVPFSSGQMRNWAQGVTNTSTLGLVRTDKFFNSQTAKTIGTIAGGVAAAGVAAAVGRAAYTTYGPGGTAPLSIFQSAKTVASSTAQAAQVAQKIAPTVAQTTEKVASTTGSLFNLDTAAKTLDVASKLAQVTGQVMAPAPPQQMGYGYGSPMMPPPGMYVDPNLMLPPGMSPVPIPGQPGVMAMDPYAQMFGGGGQPQMVMTGGGGGGFGPPGSEFVMDPATGQMVPADGSSSMMPTILLVGGGVLLLYVILQKRKK